MSDDATIRATDAVTDAATDAATWSATLDATDAAAVDARPTDDIRHAVAVAVAY